MENHCGIRDLRGGDAEAFEFDPAEMPRRFRLALNSIEIEEGVRGRRSARHQ